MLSLIIARRGGGRSLLESVRGMIWPGDPRGYIGSLVRNLYLEGSVLLGSLEILRPPF